MFQEWENKNDQENGIKVAHNESVIEYLKNNKLPQDSPKILFTSRSLYSLTPSNSPLVPQKVVEREAQRNSSPKRENTQWNGSPKIEKSNSSNKIQIGKLPSASDENGFKTANVSGETNGAPI